MSEVYGRLSSPDGWPIVGGTVTVVDATGVQRGRATSRADGGFTVDGLDPGTHTVVAAGAGYEPSARSVAVGPAGIGLGVLELTRAGGEMLPAPGTWRIDPQHSSIQATALHLGMSRIHGRLRRFGGQIVVADPLENSSVEVTIDPSSVDSDDDTRDEHLRAPDFLDVAAHPEIGYKSDGLTRLDPRHWRVDGVLTLKGVSGPAALQVTYGGTGPDLWGGTRAAFTATTEISRDDFAIDWNQSVLAGVLAVGRTLRIDIDIQAVLT
ncbi:polyisoprenoid-binding protein YceI [Pseudonocardia sediminis]|uniref:Polyisoprenoid-binding protein YceI n=1 Tax=Pseudonocardia sediminis TaxID=1397368 RepID=A0A4Q7USF9_PSEST|nr:YceI family protein [Pseudonocardia sediminis]RZT84586.1 polyisoprenoid-binding protein YceI [Pseudonocardia sediminis]